MAPGTVGAEGGRAPRGFRVVADGREVVDPAVEAEFNFVWVCIRRVTREASTAYSAGTTGQQGPFAEGLACWQRSGEGRGRT